MLVVQQKTKCQNQVLGKRCDGMLNTQIQRSPAQNPLEKNSPGCARQKDSEADKNNDLEDRVD